MFKILSIFLSVKNKFNVCMGGKGGVKGPTPRHMRNWNETYNNVKETRGQDGRGASPIGICKGSDEEREHGSEANPVIDCLCST